MTFIIPYEKVEDIPLAEYKKLHKQYWDYIADHNQIYKPFIRNKNGEPISIVGSCFACEYLRQIQLRLSARGFTCDNCPIVAWRKQSVFGNGCLVPDSDYVRWSKYGDSVFAENIANLEWEDIV